MTKRTLGSSRDRAAGSVKSSNRRIQLLASLKVGGSEMRARGASRGRENAILDKYTLVSVFGPMDP